MHVRRTWIRLAVAAAAVALAAPLAARADDQADMAKMVANAKTAADHEALATHYDKEAAEARAQAEVHRKMAATYQSGTSSGKGSGPVPLPQHCMNLAKDYDDAAANYTALAAAHRVLAKEAK